MRSTTSKATGEIAESVLPWARIEAAVSTSASLKKTRRTRAQQKVWLTGLPGRAFQLGGSWDCCRS